MREKGPLMNTVLLIQKIHEIKDSLGEVSLARIQQMLNEAEQYALSIQRESPEQARRASRVVEPRPFRG
jgi:hypothetical protein